MGKKCEALDRLISHCQECQNDCKDGRYPLLKLLAEAKEVKDVVNYKPIPDAEFYKNWDKVEFWIRG